MFQERIDHFHEVRKRFDAKIKELENEKADMEAKITKAREMYEIALINDIDDGSRKTQAEMSKCLRQAEDLDKQVRDISKRIERIRQLKNDKLRELLPGLHQARNLALEQQRQKVFNCKKGALELKAKTILFFRELNKPFKEAQKLDNEFKTACHLVGDHTYDRDWLNMPALNLTSTYTGRYAPLAALPNDLTDAYNFGYIPAFVRLYESTGEILPEEKAAEKLAQIKREAESNVKA